MPSQQTRRLNQVPPSPISFFFVSRKTNQNFVFPSFFLPLPVASHAIRRAGFNVRNVRKTLRSISVAIQTCRHCERRNLLDHVHILYSAVTVLTFDPRIHVETVTEINVIGKLLDSFPGNWFSFVVVFCEFNYYGLCFFCNRVAVHTSAYSWNNCVSRPINTDVAVCTINFHCAYVELVRKSDWLLWCVTDAFPCGPRNKISDCNGG